MSSEEVDVRAGHEVLMEADDTILLIFGDPQGILNQQLRPCLIRLINIIIILIKDVILYIIYYSIGNKL
jgi:hypothetical protein